MTNMTVSLVSIPTCIYYWNPSCQLHSKYYKSREVYDKVYDIMVRIAKLGMDKLHEALSRHLRETLKDPAGAEYFDKTWSMPSGHGRWAICHGGYSGTQGWSAPHAARLDEVPLEVVSCL